MIDLILGLYFIICLKFLVEFYKLATFMLLYLFYCCFLYILIISLVSACGVLVMRQRRLCEEELHIYLWLCLLYFLGHSVLYMSWLPNHTKSYNWMEQWLCQCPYSCDSTPVVERCRLHLILY